jgi:peptidoglycan/LPS O-acetylase OafA/YrhL
VSALWAGAMVRRYVDRPQLPVGRFLNSGPMVKLGHLSYSLYLWHILFVNPYSHSIVNRFPISLALAFAVAWLSREYVEKPFLRLKTRFQPRVGRAGQSSTTRSRKGTAPSSAPSS